MTLGLRSTFAVHPSGSCAPNAGDRITLQTSGLYEGGATPTDLDAVRRAVAQHDTARVSTMATSGAAVTLANGTRVVVLNQNRLNHTAEVRVVGDGGPGEVGTTAWIDAGMLGC